MTEQTEAVEKPRRGRPPKTNRTRRRSSATSRRAGPLSLSGDLDHENYVYRVANDEGNRIEELESYGFEVDKSHNVSLGSDNAIKTGSAHTVVVDKRTGKKGVLMRQPREFHEEDKKAKAELIDKTEESMFRKLQTDDGRYGEVERTDSLARSVDD